VPEAMTTRLKEKIAKLREEIGRLNALNARMMASEDKQISLSDADARSMATSGKGSGIVGYNVQSAVDTTHHLIVAHEVTNVGTDRSQLSNMAEQARAETGAETLMSWLIVHITTARKSWPARRSALRHATEANDFKRQSCRPLRQAGLQLRCDGRYLSLPRRRCADLPLHERGGRQDAAPLVDDACQTCALKAQCTPGKEPPNIALGARGCSRDGAGPARPQP